MTFRGEGDVESDKLDDDTIKMFAIVFRIISGTPPDVLTDRELFDATSELVRLGYMDIRIKSTPRCLKVRSQMMLNFRPASPVRRFELPWAPELNG